MQEYRNLFLNKNFILLWLSQILTQLTINIMNFILIIRLYQFTNSTIATSLLWISYALPAVIVGPFAATISDFLDKKFFLRLSTFVQSLIFLVYGITHHKSVFLIFVITACYSFVNQFYIPAEFSSLPLLVDIKTLPHANGLFFITQQLALITGFGLASYLSEFLGFNNLIFFLSILLLLAHLSVSFLPSLNVKEEKFRFSYAFKRFFVFILQGFRLIRNEKSVLTPFLLLLGMQVCLAIILVNAPIIAIEIFTIDIKKAGIFLVVPTGLGTGIGAILIPRLLRKGIRKIKVIRSSIFVLSILFFLFITFPTSLLGRAKILLDILGLMILGSAYVGIVIPSQTFLQEKTPQAFRGRVFGNFWFVATIATILPVLASGAITEILGIKILLLGLAIFFLVTYFLLDKFHASLLKVNSNPT